MPKSICFAGCLIALTSLVACEAHEATPGHPVHIVYAFKGSKRQYTCNKKPVGETLDQLVRYLVENDCHNVTIRSEIKLTGDERDLIKSRLTDSKVTISSFVVPSSEVLGGVELIR